MNKEAKQILVDWLRRLGVNKSDADNFIEREKELVAEEMKTKAVSWPRLII